MLSVLSLFVTLASASAATWNPNDLSVLLPLPAKGEDSLMINVHSGTGLLPKAVFVELPKIVLDLQPEDVFNAMRVVGIRVDPCFTEGTQPCQKQMRLVWQPLVFEENRWTSLDAAIHTFYPVSDADWPSLTKAMAELRLGTDEALAVHPRLQREGLGGTYWAALKAITLKYCRADTLSRATAMTVNPLGTMWTFSGLDVKDGKRNPMKIPRIDGGLQGFFAGPEREGSKEFRAAMQPFPAEEAKMLTLLRDSRDAGRGGMPKEDLEAATRRALTLENPRLSNPGTVDCASCHTAHVVSSWSVRNFPEWNWEDTFMKELFGPTGQVAARPRESGEGANVLRMFGYFEDRPVIARRMHHEAEEAARLMPKP